LTRTGKSPKIPTVKAIVTGGTGFIGSHLIDRLLAQGSEVWALVRDPAKAAALEKKNVRLLRGDLFSIPPLPAAFDLVFHLAGCTRSLDAAHYYNVNQAGTASVLRALAAARTEFRLVLLSSLAAVGPSRDDHPVLESDPPHPVTAYGRSKWQGEQEALKYRDSFPVIILRPSAVYGPGDKDFLEYFRMIKKLFFPVVKVQREASVCYVKDLVEALWLCAWKDLPSGEIFNIASPDPCNWEQMGDAAVRAMKIRPRKLTISLGCLHAASVLSEIRSRVTGRISLFNRDKYRDLIQPGWVADTAKARDELSFEAGTTLDAGMEETIAWYRERGWL
jgi:nucleoside-diphosphate-sugar epimerase